MTKPELIVWGGFWEARDTPLALDELNSHASVTCYFLSEALAAHFDVHQISSFARAVDVASAPGAVAALSTFQAGFSRLKKDEPDTWQTVRRDFPGKLCSIVDLLSFGAYAEDVLFTVLPPGTGLKERLKRLRSGAAVRHMGWCAAPSICRPRTKANDDPFTIFIDHGHYAADDHTQVFIEALNNLSRDKKNPPVRVFIQTNDGVVTWSAGNPWRNDRYKRTSKVPWTTLQDYYGCSDLFCVTHRESAGLGVIEAAMSGATVVIPKDPRPFISADLIATGLPHILTDRSVDAVAQALRQAMNRGVDRKANHARLRQSHSWARAAANIGRSIARGPRLN